ncbi:MAG: M13 family metallopeptidase [Gemmatimonadota bacterium]
MASPPDRVALEAGVDSSIKPGDDFFGYANGAWLKSTEIPAGAERWSARAELDAVTGERMKKLLAETATQPAGSIGRKVADYRSAYLNEAAIEARGLTSLKPMLDSIDRVTDKAGLTILLGHTLRADVDPFNVGVFQSANVLGLSIEEGNHGEKNNIAYLLQGGLGLGDRAPYLNSDTASAARQQRYRGYVSHLLTLAGFDRSGQRADAVLAMETVLARTQTTAEASAAGTGDSLWSRADFARRAPGMDWNAFFTAAGLSGQEAFVAWQPGALVGVAALVASQPLEIWKDYLRVRLLDHFADVLPKGFADGSAALRGEPKARAQRALDATQTALGEAIGRIYVEQYFPAESKAWLQTVAANVIAALSDRISVESWMTPASRKIAVAKLQVLYCGLGYPEQWQDYSDLTVDPADPLGNLQRVEARNYRRALARLGQPVDRKAWMILPQTVGGILTFQLNAVNFPAALLQAPKFDPAASAATNYGAIGAVIGHESSHYIDLLGADYGVDGRAQHWWTAEDLAGFQAAADRLDAQFSAYRPFPDLAVNGKATQSENVADLVGLSAAFEAYRRSLGSRATDKAYVRQQDRAFFLGFARNWRSKWRDAALRAFVTTNDHAPEMYRISTVRNLDAWYDAFDIKPGDKLYLAPKDRVRVW